MVPKIVLFLLLTGVCAANLINDCQVSEGSEFPTEVCMSSLCMGAIEDQIGKELKAAFFYMTKGAIYGLDVTSRPGIAKFMFEAATEERGHAIQMLDYLTLRGKSLNFDKIIPKNAKGSSKFDLGGYLEPDVLRDLKEALEKELEVTESILNVVHVCSEYKDFHGADVFTNPILDEQYSGMRKLQGAIRTYENIKFESNDNIASYLLDHKILKGEIL